ncbi:hypothetical protein A2U01_0070264 [Trifolium medium]|uniref:Uncharacterized protein n=1 Tax=Trifolium medium TaxID=97028 RepID=A0A392SJH3_9FABA|nr:hypothetical protein [Trifolium medium]
MYTARCAATRRLNRPGSPTLHVAQKTENEAGKQSYTARCAAHAACCARTCNIMQKT